MPPCKNPSHSCCGTSTCGSAAIKPANVNDGSSSSSNTSTDHPKNLKLAVQSSIASFLSTRLTSNGDIAQDVYRTIRDEAHLLLERQLISDALDSDPFELMKMPSSSCDDDDNVDEEEEQNEDDDDDDDGSVLLDKKKNREMIERFKNMMSVISCDRTTTLEGFSSIHAVVQLTNDGMMSGVNENIRLYFTFVREPQHSNTANDDGGDSKGGVEAGLQHVDADNAGDNSSHDVVHDYSENAGKRKRGQGDEIDNKRTRLQQQEDERDEGYDDEVGDKDADNFEPKTIVTYKIDMSIDHGQRETLLGVDVYALGKQPSVEEAAPMMSDEAEDDENEEDQQLMADDEDEGVDSGADCNERRESNESSNIKQPISKENDAEFEEVEMTDTDDNNVQEEGDVGRGDRFGVFVDPQCIVSFLDRINMNLNEQSVIYFLLTFPFYEHEWDLSGFILSMFDDDDDDDEMEHEEEDDSCTSAHM